MKLIKVHQETDKENFSNGKYHLRNRKQLFEKFKLRNKSVHNSFSRQTTYNENNYNALKNIKPLNGHFFIARLVGHR